MRAVFFPDYSEGNPYQHELKAHLQSRGVSVVLRGGHRSTHWLHRLFPLLGAVRDTTDPDVVHLHWIHPFFDHPHRSRAILGGLRLVFELVVLRLLDVTVIWTIHNLLDHDNHLPKRLELAIRHVVFRLCDGSIVHCEQATEVIERAYRLPNGIDRRVSVIPHGHYIDAYPNDVGRLDARASLDLDGDETVFLYFGRIRAYKNVPALVSAFSRLERDDVRLLIVGNPASEAIARDIEVRCEGDDRIKTVLEFVPEDEVQRFMNAADVVVLPFEDVLSSGSTLLAMSFGRPVVSPALGCLTMLVSGDLTYDPSDPDGLLAALERSLETDLRALGRRSALRARRFDWHTVAARTESVYREAVA